VGAASKTKKAPAGRAQPLIAYLLRLPADRFWEEESFGAIAQAHPDFLSLQAVVWLRVLECLRNGQEDGALSLLNVARFGGQSWHEGLETAFLQILTYRRVGFTNPSLGVGTGSASRHAFFRQLDAFVRGADEVDAQKMALMLRSNGVFAEVLAAAGWREAARRLRHA